MNAPADYLKGLDGIRGLAMATVVLAHMRLVGIGWVTIQVFFVLSGFLITRILLSMREKHALPKYLKIFYARRTLRIFPIYYLFLFVVLVVSLFFAGLEREREQTWYALLYVWNWYAVVNDVKLVPYLEHFWSLSVEEQFYLCWPLLVFFARGAAFWKIVLGIVLAGPLVRFVTVLVWPSFEGVLPDTHKALYQMSTTHMDALATGALVCLAIHHPWSQKFHPHHLLLLALLAYLLGALSTGPGILRGGPYGIPLNLGYPIHMGENWQFVWGYSALNILSAGLILLVAQGRCLTWLFQNRLLQRMGVVSYSAYIFHLLLIYNVALPGIKAVQAAVGDPYLGAWLCAPAVLLMVFGLADLSYRFFESRFLLMKDSKFSTQVSPAAQLPAAEPRSAEEGSVRKGTA